MSENKAPNDGAPAQAASPQYRDWMRRERRTRATMTSCRAAISRSLASQRSTRPRNK